MWHVNNRKQWWTYEQANHLRITIFKTKWKYINKKKNTIEKIRIDQTQNVWYGSFTREKCFRGPTKGMTFFQITH